jgi:IS5 family transposase
VKKKRTKHTYRIRNWKEYNTALVRRGSLTIWVDEGAIKRWLNHKRTGKRGCPRTYTDTAIGCMLTLKAVYSLALRSTQGLTESIVKLLGIELPVPDYTTLCRRMRGLEVMLPRNSKNEPIHVVVDSTGLKVYGEGEWKVRQHGYTKRRTWRKLHLAVDESSGQIEAVVVTTNGISDGEMLEELLEQVRGEIKQVSGDGGYDMWDCYKVISKKGAVAAIPPRRGARIRIHGNSTKQRIARDEHIRRIRQVGRKRWKQEAGYHRRSLAETAIYRVKTIFGDRLSARGIESQVREMFIKCGALNRMTQLGMPDTYVVA